MEGAGTEKLKIFSERLPDSLKDWNNAKREVMAKNG